MTKIGLIGMEFHCFHGYYTEEQSVGNEYVVDIEVTLAVSPDKMNDSLDKTLNYENVYQVCKKEMDQPRHLIETVANDIIKKVVELAPPQSQVVLRMRKKNPLLGGLVDHAQVELVLKN